MLLTLMMQDFQISNIYTDIFYIVIKVVEFTGHTWAQL